MFLIYIFKFWFVLFSYDLVFDDKEYVEEGLVEKSYKFRDSDGEVKKFNSRREGSRYDEYKNKIERKKRLSYGSSDEGGRGKRRREKRERSVSRDKEDRRERRKREKMDKVYVIEYSDEEKKGNIRRER